jgi:hypothetical protein
MDAAAWSPNPPAEVDPAHGSARFPEERLTAARELIAAMGTEFGELLADASPMIRAAVGERYEAEAALLARTVGVDADRLFTAAVSYDASLAVLGCSTAIVASAYGPVLLRNMDWWPEDLLAAAACDIARPIAGGGRTIDAGWPGALGVVTGVSSRGVAVALNAASSPGELASLGAGRPVMLAIREALIESETFAQAVERLSEHELAAPCLLAVAGNDNKERVVIERTPSRATLRWADGDAPLVATNDYRALQTSVESAPDDFGLKVSACTRYDELFAQTARWDATAPVDDESALAALSHPRVRMGITAQHVVIRPRAGQLRSWMPRRKA